MAGDLRSNQPRTIDFALLLCGGHYLMLASVHRESNGESGPDWDHMERHQLNFGAKTYPFRSGSGGPIRWRDQLDEQFESAMVGCFGQGCRQPTALDVDLYGCSTAVRVMADDLDMQSEDTTVYQTAVDGHGNVRPFHE